MFDLDKLIEAYAHLSYGFDGTSGLAVTYGNIVVPIIIITLTMLPVVLFFFNGRYKTTIVVGCFALVVYGFGFYISGEAGDVKAKYTTTSKKFGGFRSNESIDCFMAELEILWGNKTDTYSNVNSAYLRCKALDGSFY